MKLYLIRHGQPELLEYSGFPGPKLGALGQAQSEVIRNVLELKNIQKVLSSDYTRVIETARPFLRRNEKLEYAEVVELRERENEIESHESLVSRVQGWFAENLELIKQQDTAIFGHCGSINMILFYLDPDLTLMDYPFEDKYKCLTPLGGIWELHIEDKELIEGQLIYDGRV